MMLSTLSLPLLCLLLAAASYLLCGLAARRRFLVDEVTVRSNHARPTSRAGGAVILFLFAVVISVAAVGLSQLPVGLPLLVLTAGALGLADDRMDLSASHKLFALIFIGGATGIVTGPITGVPLPFLGMAAIPAALGYPAAALFVLAFVNIFNFMDGLNGMAAGVAMVGLGFLTLSGGMEPGIAFAALVLAASLYGFAIRNILKGDVFLGDAGSLSIGLFLAGAVLASGRHGDGATFYALAIAFIPYILDTGVTLFRRWRRGAPLMEAHKEHFYQHLRAKGWSHQAVSLAYAAMTLACGALGLGGQQLLGEGGLWLGAIASAGLFFSVVTVMARRSGEADDGAQGQVFKRPA